MTTLWRILLLTGAAALTALPLPARSAEPTVDHLMSQLLHPDTGMRSAALRQIVQRAERTAVPGLIDVLRFDLFLDSTVADGLDRLTGQSFGHDWIRWVEWLAERQDVRPHGEYAAWKAALFQLIDPAFGELLYAGVKHRARLEEIQWGGVVVNDTVGATPVVLVGTSATRTVRAYERRDLRFRPGPGPDEMVEMRTGERWRIEEEALVAVTGGRRLPRLAGHLAYWFGWFAFHPETPVYGR
jgi:hypothetical protein